RGAAGSPDPGLLRRLQPERDRRDDRGTAGNGEDENERRADAIAQRTGGVDMNEQEFHELAAGHALHALSEADERRFALARSDHPEWQTEVEHDEETVAALAATLEPVEPPASLRAALLAQIAALAQDPAGSGDDAPGNDARARDAAPPEGTPAIAR